MRFARPPRLGLFVALALVGCQSGGQSDLVTRELRMQEDQIYAMEDYLAQYQQLLCKVRAENAALRQRLAAAEAGETLPAPAEQPESSRDRQRVPQRGPAFRAPGRTPATEAPLPPETEMIEPDVPPLEETTLFVPRLVVRGQSPDTDVLSDATTKFVQLRGEVVANDAGGGPRLAIDVEAMSAALEPVRFVGALSLMLLEPSNNGPPHSLARWDYNPADAEKVQDEGPQQGTMRFHLELPADTPTDRKSELWVRLMPQSGGKVLVHAAVDLSRPGRFESKVGSVATQEALDDKHNGGSPPSIANPPNNNIETSASAAAPRLKSPIKTTPIKTSPIRRPDDEGWTIARPDRPGQLGVGAANSSASWRAASGPLPVIAESVPAAPQKFVPRPQVQQAAFVDVVKTPQPVAPPSPGRRTARAVPLWTPDRGGKAPDAAKATSDRRQPASGRDRPVWSPSR